jgi:histidinol-phosphatase (PHP family)
VQFNSGDGTTRLASLHTHSRYCDGRGEVREYAEAAIAAGLAAYGASSHAPLPFHCSYAMPLDLLDAYCHDVRTAAETVAGRIPVLLGLELDYLPGLGDFYARELLARGFEYFVASVHYVAEPGAEPWAYDESPAAFEREVRRRHGGDARPVVEDYYRRLALMAREVGRWGVPIIVGHFDRIVLWNRDDCYFPTDSEWYLALVDEALDAIAAAGLVLEINTSGWAKAAARPNPGRDILVRGRARGIPVTVSADAHRPDNVAYRYPDAVDVLRSAGYAEVVLPGRAEWTRVPLSTA